MTTTGPESNISSVFTRLASADDVPHIRLLIEGLADFEKLTDECQATDEALRSSIFKLPPYQGPTVLILEVAEDAEEAAENAERDEAAQAVTEVLGDAGRTVVDPDRTKFQSAYNDKRTVAGFVLFFPNYSTFLARHGFYIEDLYVREPYRSLGFGTKLLSTVARLAVKEGAGRVEWAVLDWNEKAITFYKNKIGAEILDEWRSCRLTGPSLEAAAKLT
eukprot:jgi/Mesen1/10389/ME000081S09779